MSQQGRAQAVYCLLGQESLKPSGTQFVQLYTGWLWVGLLSALSGPPAPSGLLVHFVYRPFVCFVCLPNVVVVWVFLEMGSHQPQTGLELAS